MTQPGNNTRDEITRAVAAFMPSEWALVERPGFDEEVVLSNGTHCLFFGIRHGSGYGKPAQWSVSAFTTKAVQQAYSYSNAEHRVDGINVSQDKSPDQIARDIKRRLLPQVAEVGTRLQAQIKRITREGEEYKEYIRRVTGACGGEALHVAKNGHYRDGEIVTSGHIYPDGPISSNIYRVEITGGYGAAIEVRKASPELTARLIETVRQYQQEQRDAAAAPVVVEAPAVVVEAPAVVVEAPAVAVEAPAVAELDAPAPEPVAVPALVADVAAAPERDEAPLFELVPPPSTPTAKRRKAAPRITAAAQPRTSTETPRVKVQQIEIRQSAISGDPSKVLTFDGPAAFAKAKNALLMASFDFPRGYGSRGHIYKITWQDGATYSGSLRCRHFKDKDANLDVSEALIKRLNVDISRADRDKAAADKAAQIMAAYELGGATNGK